MRAAAGAAKTLASGADLRGEVLLTNDMRNMDARERSYVKAMQLCQIVRAATKTARLPAEAKRSKVGTIAYVSTQRKFHLDSVLP